MNRRTFELAASAAALTALLVGGAIPAGADDLPSSVLAVAPMAPVEVLGDSFPSVLQAMQDTAAPRLQATADDGAVGRSGKGRMVWSSVPLEADGKPVQRALRVSGGTAEPANPLVDARLPLDASEPVVVGSGAGRFTFTAIGADDGAERVVGDGVLHQDTHRETDSIVRAVTGGAESYELISGTGAPQEFRYRVTGATPHADPSGDVMLIADGKTIGRVQAPVVVDSAGHDVAASLSVDGDVVVFHVAHRRTGVSYPVLADPTWLAGYNFLAAGEGADGLTYENPTGQYRIAAVTGGNLPGITIKPFGGSHVYTVADRAIATFTAPPGSTIDKVAFKGVHRRNDSDRQTMRLGLYKADPALLGKAKDYSDTVTALDEDEVLLDDESDTSRFAVIEMFTPPCTVADPCQAISANNGTRVTVENLEVTLVDNGAPSFQWTGTLPQLGSGWVKAEGTETLGMEGFDDGSGVRTLSANQVQGAATPLLLNPKTMACDDLHQPGHGAFPCPEQPPFEEQDVVLSSLLEGRVQIVGHATDYVNNADDGSSPKLMLRLDKSAPAVVRLFGSLVDGAADRWTQLHGTVEANVEAADRYSGVKDVDLSITPVDPAGTPDSQPLPACGQPGDIDQPCPTSVTTGADIDGDALPDGTLEVAATAHDYVGYDSQVATKRVYKDNTPPAATAKGELTRLEDQWTASTANTAVTLQGKDRRSGISRLQLYARDDNGKRLIDDIQVCDPATANAATGADACPLTVSQSTTVDLGDLATGQVTLEAYATDAAGNRDPSPDSWDTYVDHDPPGEVGRITAIRPKSGPIRVSWTPAVDDGSGLDGYEYRLTDDSGTTGEWVTTPTPGASIPTELQNPIIEVRAKDKAGNRGEAKREILPAIVGVAAALAIRWAACKAAKAGAAAVDRSFGEIVSFICDWLLAGKAFDVASAGVIKVVQKVCKISAGRCGKLVDATCSFVGKAWDGGCGVVKVVACFASPVDLHCDASQRAFKALNRLRRALRTTVLKELPGGGTIRMFGRDAANRATKIRATVTPKTVELRQQRADAGRAKDGLDIPGLGDGIDRGHLLARILGGPGDDARNFVPLPEGFNRGRMRSVENQIKKAVVQGRVVKVEVGVVYRGTGAIPDVVVIRARTIDKVDDTLADFSLDRALKVQGP